MKQETIGYFRRREQAEREAVLTASCPQARRAHEQMAAAYAGLIRREELKALATTGAEVITIAEPMRRLGDGGFGSRTLPSRTWPLAGLRRI
jgi:hypothetical protein